MWICHIIFKRRENWANGSTYGQSVVLMPDQNNTLEIAIPSQNLFFWYTGLRVGSIVVGHSEKTS